MCCVIIEEGRAADDVEELAKIPGIDLLFIGTSDLTLSIMGDKSKLSDPKVQTAI